jgi:hypothetical protein
MSVCENITDFVEIKWDKMFPVLHPQTDGLLLLSLAPFIYP